MLKKKLNLRFLFVPPHPNQMNGTQIILTHGLKSVSIPRSYKVFIPSEGPFFNTIWERSVELPKPLFWYAKNSPPFKIGSLRAPSMAVIKLFNWPFLFSFLNRPLGVVVRGEGGGLLVEAVAGELGSAVAGTPFSTSADIAWRGPTSRDKRQS